jgi:hypothetical protein
MKFMIGTTALFLILFSAPAFAQDEPKPQQQEEHKPQDSKAPAPEKAPPEKPAAEQPKEKQPPPAKSQPKPQTDEKQQQEQKAKEKQTQQQQKAQPAQAHNAPAQSGGNKRIPDDKFRSNFGSQHHFRPARGNNGRFQYGGYWFVYTDAWPSGWSYDDDCYIEDDGGVYYLVDALHPDFRLVVAVEIS